MKKQLITLTVFAAAIGFMQLASCKSKKSASAACTPVPTYTADIKSILDASCMPCHSAEKKKHNVDLSSYEGAKAAAADKSFMGSVRHEVGFDAMPMKRDKLSDATIAKLACWIDKGCQQMPKDSKPEAAPNTPQKLTPPLEDK